MTDMVMAEEGDAVIPLPSTEPPLAGHQTTLLAAAAAAASAPAVAGAGAGAKEATVKRRRNADDTKLLELGESEEAHVVLMSVKGRSREEASRGVCFSKVAKASQLHLSEDQLTVTGQKGFSTVRASHGVHTGTWYCEFTVVGLKPSGHVRLGWCTRKAELQAPVGFDEHGYSFRDVEGSKVHNGKREDYGVAYGEGDVIGALIHLPEGGHPIEARSKKMVRYKGEIFYEEEPEKVPAILEGSSLEFFVNGANLGEAFGSLLEGTWYPAASVFSGRDQDKVKVQVNFGPDFKHPPVHHLKAWRPFSDVSIGQPP